MKLDPSATTTQAQEHESLLGQLRLLLEEVCCDLCRFEHVSRHGCSPESVQIDREFYLGTPGAFADIRVVPPGQQAYFVEVKYGYSFDTLLRHLRRKYGPETSGSTLGSKIILVIDSEDHRGRAPSVGEFARNVHPGLELEVWDEQHLLSLIRERFGTDLPAITAESLVDVRQVIDAAKGFHAFAGESIEQYEHDPLKAQLLWHFGFWRLRQLRARGRRTPREILPPETYRRAAVLIADLCSFSSYVRDTPNSDILRESLTAFCSKARYQIINNGGMLYQFVGDQVVGIFGIPEADDTYVPRAVATAQALVAIGESVSNHWQRRIDRVQTSGGLHVGIAIGDLQIVSLRPFSRTHMGAIGDCINVAARLMESVGQSEIAVSNSFYQQLSEEDQAIFLEAEPIEAKNVGRIRSWRLPRDTTLRPWQNGQDAYPL
ncbi:MAG: adenylate/guanylate cyclase domain-containing protein [Gammaproteobacteria bacterium]